MFDSTKYVRRPVCGVQRGFSLLEMLVALVVLLAVAGIVMAGLVQMSKTEGTVVNRTEMHSSVRNATELLQQEIGQAGKITLKTPVTLSAAVTALGASTVAVSSTAELFANEKAVIDAGSNQETVTLTAVTATQITATFFKLHANGAKLQIMGGFGTGVIPPTANGMANGSTGTVLKLYGDINSDGDMVYVEYTCDIARGNLYRNMMLLSAGAKPAIAGAAGDPMILLPNVQANPDGSPCFTYQVAPAACAGTSCYVVNVAVTLTVQTAFKDPQTKQFQSETKALLNVSPRNVFNVWQLAGAGITDRLQPLPATVTAFLP